MKTKLNEKKIKRRRFEEKRKTKPQTTSFSFITKENQKLHLNIEDEKWESPLKRLWSRWCEADSGGSTRTQCLEQVKLEEV